MANAHRHANIRFTEKTEYTPTCWLWTGFKATNGYGQFGDRGRLHQSHRWSFERLVGPIPRGMVLDHLCRTRNCVNPLHLEVVTQSENVARGHESRFGQKCRNGHPRTPENVHVRRDGSRYCRECKRIRDRRKQAAA